MCSRARARYPHASDSPRNLISRTKEKHPQKDERRGEALSGTSSTGRRRAATLRPAVTSPPNNAELGYLQRGAGEPRGRQPGHRARGTEPAPRRRQSGGPDSRRPGCAPRSLPAAPPQKAHGTRRVGVPPPPSPLTRSLSPPRAAALSHRGRCLLFAGRSPLHRGAPPPTASRPRSAACRRGAHAGRRPFRGGGAGAAVADPLPGPISRRGGSRRDGWARGGGCPTASRRHRISPGGRCRCYQRSASAEGKGAPGRPGLKLPPASTRRGEAPQS